MGYFINKEVAAVNSLQKITLANNPHFIQFTSLKEATGKNKRIELYVTNYKMPETDANINIDFVEELSGKSHLFTGTYDKNKVNKTTFLIVRKGDETNEKKDIATLITASALTAQNLQACMMQDSFFRNNFEITTALSTSHHGNVTALNLINIVAKGIGAKYNLSIKVNPEGSFVRIDAVLPSIEGYDTIDYNTGNYSIELDVYTDTGVFLGENEALSNTNQGNYLTTLSKAYHKKEIWFDINSLLSKKMSYSDSFVDAEGWCNIGTISDFRLIGKRNNGINHDVFYSSEVLYVLNGYDYTLNTNNMEDYVLDVVNFRGKKIKPLNTQPSIDHSKGQKHFFNFILKDDVHNLSIPGFNPPQSSIGLLYRMYTQSGQFIGENVAHEQAQKDFDMVNAIEIALDKQIEATESSTGKTVGIVDVILSVNGNEASDALRLEVQASAGRVKNFGFLNRLGGWSTFNFGNDESIDFKATTETFHKTLLPNYTSYSQLESLARKSVSEQLTLKTQSLSHSVAQWLRELSASPAVYDLDTKRYVIVDELALKYNLQDDYFQAEMKFHYSDSFNSGVNSIK